MSERLEQLVESLREGWERDAPESALSAAALTTIAEAQAALAEQQRIANLIALALHTGDNDENTDLLRAEAMDALVEWVPHSPDDEHPEIRRSIAATLGVKTGGNGE